jgi:small subunit ribosomal protein S1
VSVGQEVEVEVLDVDLDRERVSLSLKATQEDPWKEFERRYQAGEVISGQVTKLVPFGAFVRVAQGIEGLVHISELAEGHVESPEAVLSVGDQVRVKVIDVDVSRRRVSLSMRQVGGQPAAVEREIEEEAPTRGRDGSASEGEPSDGRIPRVEGDGAGAPERDARPEPAPAERAGSGAAQQDEDEVSLESILEDLKRREGRSD